MEDSSKDNQISRREFVKLVGAGSLFFGLGASGERSGSGTYRIAQAHKRYKVA
jgi:hypothetical protein